MTAVDSVFATDSTVGNTTKNNVPDTDIDTSRYGPYEAFYRRLQIGRAVLCCAVLCCDITLFLYTMQVHSSIYHAQVPVLQYTSIRCCRLRTGRALLVRHCVLFFGIDFNNSRLMIMYHLMVMILLQVLPSFKFPYFAASPITLPIATAACWHRTTRRYLPFPWWRGSPSRT